MSARTLAAAALVILMSAAARADESATVSTPKIRAKKASAAAAAPASSYDAEPTPDTEVIDAPTSAVLDDHGYSTRSRFFSSGGLQEYLAFGVYPGLNLGASTAADGLVGSGKTTRVRAPSVQVKYRFYQGSQTLPSLAIGYDGQGYEYNALSQRYNQRQRGVYLVGSQELGMPGLQIHPSFNISDFNSNAIFGSIPVTLNIRNKAELLAEWDNIADWSHSRLNAGVRAWVNPYFHVEFAVRAIGAGGQYSDGASRGPERIVELKYTNSF